MVAGRRPVLELLRAGRRRVDRIAVQAGTRPPDEILAVARARRIPVEEMPAADVRRRAGTEVHQGVLAFAAPLPHADFRDLLTDARFVVALDEVADPRNLGAIIRVAEAAGADCLLLTERRSAPLSATAYKAAAGAAEWLPIAWVPNLANALAEARDAGMWVVGMEAGGQEPAVLALLDERVVLVVGSEGGGLRPRVRSACDAFVGIPMRGHVSSLNVSSAVAVVAFAVAHRHAAAERPEGTIRST